MTFPIRLLTVAYGAAIALAFSVWALGAGPFLSALTAWFGGAGITLAFAVLPGASNMLAACPGTAVGDTELLQIELQAWDRDLADERAAYEVAIRQAA
ncbi:MAG: hypothetical protein AAF713_08140 [Pseudomonadota bacterium]